MIQFYYHKFETLVSFAKVWAIAFVSIYLQPIAELLFMPIAAILQNFAGAEILNMLETYWHFFTALVVGVVAIASFVKIRKETKKTILETKKVELETKLKEKELQNYDMDHKFDELRMDIMFAEERLAAYRNAEEKLKKLSIEEFTELVNKL